jgi:glycosyltransferase involved in cell wall biosynthesis
MRFSILMPVYNRENFLRQAIESVLSQTFRDYELFAIDDGSTDRSPEIIQSYGSKVKFLQQPNQGAEAARNYAAAHAKGEYLVYLDSDDYFLPFALETYDQVIRYFDSPPFILGGMFHKQAEEEIDPRELQVEPIAVLKYPNFLARNDSIGSSVFIVRRTAFDEIGGLRKNTNAKTWYSDDNNLMLKLGTHSPFIYINRPRTAVYRLHSENSVRNLKGTVDGLVNLAKAERRGEYPGGQKVRTFIGRRSAAFAYGRCWRGGERGLALRLLLRTAPLVMAALWNAARRNLKKGPQPILLPSEPR